MSILILSQKYGLPVLDLSALDLKKIPHQLVSENLMRKHTVLAIAYKNNILFLAIADPTHRTAIDEIKFYTGLTLSIVLAEEQQLKKIIDEILTNQEKLEKLSDLALAQVEEQISVEEINKAPIVQLVQEILLEAIRKRSSDIHFEPYEKEFRIRFRIDGLLYETLTISINLSRQIIARIKILSNLDIAERRIPQDGRFQLTSDHHDTTDFRVSTCPTMHGEKIVIRILDKDVALIDLNKLGFNDQQLKLFKVMLAKPQGLILVTGPTGSGKTVTLYSALRQINRKEVNILTVEDPVEINLTGINQVIINPKVGLTFATALRAFLRQDPDIIMVGEIRDFETAEIAIKAAQTGHLVLSTLHTNSSAETLNRLLNMGITPYDLASCVSLIIAQRLARKLCAACKTQIYNLNGCEKCTNGYKGRIGIFEVLPINETIKQLIIKRSSSMEIEMQARKEGMQTLYEDGLLKVKNGLTSEIEINRVTKN